MNIRNLPTSPGVRAANPHLFPMGATTAIRPRVIPEPQTALKPILTPETTKSPDCVKFTIPGAPMGKPRQTQSDRWKKRPCVLRYREWADRARAAAPELPKEPKEVSWVAYFPMPESWSKKKKAEMKGQPHQSKPDRDNVDKAILDSLLQQDCMVSDGQLTKRWDDGNGPRIEVLVK